MLGVENGMSSQGFIFKICGIVFGFVFVVISIVAIIMKKDSRYENDII